MAKLHMDDIAEGGVLGAKQYFPGFDISGSVRLDLSVQGHTKAVELHFMRRLNAVLIETDDLLEKPAVAVHFLGGRAHSSFDCRGDNVWADPLECPADLYELQLGSQVDEMRGAPISRCSSGFNHRNN